MRCCCFRALLVAWSNAAAGNLTIVHQTAATMVARHGGVSWLRWTLEYSWLFAMLVWLVLVGVLSALHGELHCFFVIDNWDF
jgi:hypothetical protein